MQIKIELPMPLIGRLKLHAKRNNRELKDYIEQVLKVWHHHILKTDRDKSGKKA